MPTARQRRAVHQREPGRCRGRMRSSTATKSAPAAISRSAVERRWPPSSANTNSARRLLGDHHPSIVASRLASRGDETAHANAGATSAGALNEIVAVADGANPPRLSGGRRRRGRARGARRWRIGASGVQSLPAPKPDDRTGRQRARGRPEVPRSRPERRRSLSSVYLASTSSQTQPGHLVVGE